MLGGTAALLATPISIQEVASGGIVAPSSGALPPNVLHFDDGRNVWRALMGVQTLKTRTQVNQVGITSRDCFVRLEPALTERKLQVEGLVHIDDQDLMRNLFVSLKRVRFALSFSEDVYEFRGVLVAYEATPHFDDTRTACVLLSGVDGTRRYLE